MILIEFLIKS